MYKSYDDLPSVLSVKELKDFLGISRAGAYQLLHREDSSRPCTLHPACWLRKTSFLRGWSRIPTP